MDFNAFSWEGVYIFLLVIVSALAIILFMGIRAADKDREAYQQKLGESLKREKDNQ